jgi:hypothetical protein
VYTPNVIKWNCSIVKENARRARAVELTCSRPDMHEVRLDLTDDHSREPYHSDNEEVSAKCATNGDFDYPLHPYTAITCTESLRLMRSMNICKSQYQ